MSVPPLRLPGPLSPWTGAPAHVVGLPRTPLGSLTAAGKHLPWPAPGFLCCLHCFVLISFMIIEKILGSCHQILTEPLMSLIYPASVSNSILHIYAFLSPAIKVKENVTLVEMPVRTI